MFKFLKDKLKNAVSKFSKDVDEKTEDIEPEEIKAEDLIEKSKEEKEEQPEEKGQPSEEKETLEKKEEPETKEEPEQAETPKEKKKGFFSRMLAGKGEKTKEALEEPGPKEEPDKEQDTKQDKDKSPKPTGKIDQEKEPGYEEGSKAVEEPDLDAEENFVEGKEEKRPKEEPVEDKAKDKDAEDLLEEVDEDLKETEEKLKEPIAELPEEKGKGPKEEDEHGPQKEPKQEKKGFFGRVKEAITKKSLSEREFDDLFFELEVVLLENNVAVEVIEKIKADLRKELVETKVLRGKVKDIIENTLRSSLIEILDIESIDLLKKIKEKKPFVIAVIGINGTGKTTTVAKIANYLKKHNLTSVMAAADTFRAAAIQQLEEHAKNLDIKIIKHDYGSDPAAVSYDAIEYARAKGIDVVLIDTAGRQHSNSNLMDELKKVIRVSKPDMKIFIGDSLTGNDCVEQSTKFDEAVGIDANVLTKVDADEKGGAALSVAYVTKKPIIFIGSGQEYDNLERFDYNKVIERIGL